MTHMRCHVCKSSVQIRTREGDGVWAVFCTPKEAYDWQQPLTEDEIIAQTSGPGMPYDRCQWCHCTLKSGYHENGCQVRAYAASLPATAP